VFFSEHSVYAYIYTCIYKHLYLYLYVGYWRCCCACCKAARTSHLKQYWLVTRPRFHVSLCLPNWASLSPAHSVTTLHIILVCNVLLVIVWRGGIVVRASDLQPRGRGSSLGRSAPRATLGKLFTHLCLCSPSSINWYRRKLGAKFHATHEPRVRGLVASAGVWLMAIETEISATGPREGR